ncbi:MAG: hypothetical protein HY762_09385 [Planctomycetes bacterium]|nr:hypothetical protein [Planctomycetota bacterium]
MQKVISDVWQTIRKQRLFSVGDTIVLGVSGGADSVSLAVILSKINQYYKQNLTLVIAHLNHKIRGQAAKQDEAFVRRLAAKLNMPFYRKERNIPALSKRLKLSLEETARLERYRFFEEVVRRYKPYAGR